MNDDIYSCWYLPNWRQILRENRSLKLKNHIANRFCNFAMCGQFDEFLEMYEIVLPVAIEKGLGNPLDWVDPLSGYTALHYVAYDFEGDREGSRYRMLVYVADRVSDINAITERGATAVDRAFCGYCDCPDDVALSYLLSIGGRFGRTSTEEILTHYSGKTIDEEYLRRYVELLRVDWELGFEFVLEFVEMVEREAEEDARIAEEARGVWRGVK